MPISDLRRILEGLASLAGKNLSPSDMAETLRLGLAQLLLQQISQINAQLPLVNLAPDLEQLILRTSKQSSGSGLLLENALAEKILTELSAVSERLSAEGRQPVVVVAPQIRREFSRFIRTHLADAIVMAVTEIPDNRKIELAATIGSLSDADNL